MRRSIKFASFTCLSHTNNIITIDALEGNSIFFLLVKLIKSKRNNRIALNLNVICLGDQVNEMSERQLFSFCIKIFYSIRLSTFDVCSFEIVVAVTAAAVFFSNVFIHNYIFFVNIKTFIADVPFIFSRNSSKLQLRKLKR